MKIFSITNLAYIKYSSIIGFIILCVGAYFYIIKSRKIFAILLFLGITNIFILSQKNIFLSIYSKVACDKYCAKITDIPDNIEGLDYYRFLDLSCPSALACLNENVYFIGLEKKDNKIICNFHTRNGCLLSNTSDRICIFSAFNLPKCDMSTDYITMVSDVNCMSHIFYFICILLLFKFRPKERIIFKHYVRFLILFMIIESFFGYIKIFLVLF